MAKFWERQLSGDEQDVCRLVSQQREEVSLKEFGGLRKTDAAGGEEIREDGCGLSPVRLTQTSPGSVKWATVDSTSW